MHNILDNPDDSAECTVWRTDSFTFLGSNNAVSYHGYGLLSNDSLHMYYIVQYDTSTYNCHYFGQGLR
jgi:hypothetical protein